MLYNRLFACGLLLVCTVPLRGQASARVAAFTVDAGAYDRWDTPVCSEMALDSTGAYSLVETTGDAPRPVAVQYADSRLCWRLSGETPAGQQRTFQLISEATGPSPEAVTAESAGGRVVFRIGEREVLTYQDAAVAVPEGVDPIFSRGGFIHPLRTLNGATLSRIQPPDHYHHYGVWGPWTHTRYRDREIDFWNLVRGQGTVDARGVSAVGDGAVYGDLTAARTYLIFQDSAVTENPTEVLDETVDLRVYATDPGAPGYLVDFTSVQRNITEFPLTVEAYRYQGFSIRATPEWNDDNVELITSAGYGKADGNGTRARWVKVSGPTEAGQAGLLMMTHPDNFNAPEQIRIWPVGANEGKENVFVNFNPAQDRDYVLQPGRAYERNYRLYVYDGQLDTVAANRLWQDFAYPPVVKRTDRAGALEGKRVLVYTRNGEGYVHENIPASVDALQQLGRDHGFSVTATEDPGVFTPDGLADFDVLVFSNTNNKIFDTPEQREVFRAYIEGGKSFVAIHSACGSERDWPWFAKTLGARFYRHPPRQDFDVVVVDEDHPSTDFLPPTWHIRDDECYYMTHLNPQNHVLLATDLTTVEDERASEYPGATFGDLFPAAWYNTAHGGRQWYTSLGHRSEHYRDPLFLRHILGGIEWAATKSK
ncbi:type 1 glutamine amidotransferase [Neolewinella xylanilytica]|uniref:Type 1 glutamine amidotransferase n=1 Tax=Neolewinella xylanilytica TaxID=1514080 RepID=A0A2S6IB78_9BACT|nr:ThuA domain-containing protein [Neolewinella xylanilytica]PPK88761.1 type 1 glutamine amidotransferase [Neolewinella xylanilytica]